MGPPCSVFGAGILAGGMRVSAQLRSMVTFRHHNLLRGASGLGLFDVIFCRNVLIYFDPNRKRFVLEELAKALAPDGALLLGSAETILGLTENIVQAPGARGLYQKASVLRASAVG